MKLHLAIGAVTLMVLGQLVANGFDLINYLTDGKVTIPLMWYGLASLVTMGGLIYLLIKPEKRRRSRR